jgi:hypothetical protein
MSEITARLATPTGFAEIVSDDFPILHARIMRVYDSGGNVIEARGRVQTAIASKTKSRHTAKCDG